MLTDVRMVAELVATELYEVGEKMLRHAADPLLMPNHRAALLHDDLHFSMAYLVGVLGAASPETNAQLERGLSRINDAYYCSVPVRGAVTRELRELHATSSVTPRANARKRKVAAK